MDLAAEIEELKRQLALAKEEARGRVGLDSTFNTPEHRYRALFDSIDEGFCIIEVLGGDRGDPVDYRFLETNASFERQTGLVDAVGKRIRELAPDLEEHWFERYSRIAQNQTPERFEDRAEALGRWYDVYAFPIDDPELRRVGILFRDIIERKRAEGTRRQNEERQAFLLKLSDALRPLDDAGEIQAATARLLGEQLCADRAMYGEVSGERGSEIGVIRGQYIRPATPGRPAPAAFPDHFTFESFGAEVMARRYSGEGLAVADVNADAGFDEDERAAWAMVGVQAAIVAPLVKGGRLVAELGVHSETPRTWTEAEISLVHEVGERTWAAAERARAEAALRESEEKYRGLFERIDEGFSILELLYDDAGRAFDAIHLEANPAHARHSGLDGIVGKRVFEVLPADEARYWVAFYDKVARTGQASRIESEITGIDRWVAVHVSRLGGANSRKVAVVFNDITERKQAEIALRESESLQTFLLALGDALRSASTADEKIAAAAQALGERLEASRVLWGEYDWERNVAHIFGGWFADGAQPFPTIMQLENYDGEVLRDLRAGRTVRVDNVSLLVDEPAYAAIADVGVQALLSIPLIIDGILKVNISIHQHVPRHWTDEEVGLVREVAERLWAEVVRARAEAALRESEERFVQFAAASASGLWIRDAVTLAMEYASPSLARIYGVEPDQLLGGIEKWAAAIVPDDRDTALSHIEQARKGQVAVHEFRIQRQSDGAFRWIRNTDFPLETNGHIGRIGGIAEDVSEQKLATEHQAILLAELQHRVRNIIAILRSIAARTAEGAASVEDYAALMAGRLTTFARVQALLTRGANAGVAISTIVKDELAAVAGHAAQFVAEGPDVTLPPKAAETMTLAVHELTTNALKYGALSNSAGLIVVRWSVEDRRGTPWLLFDWDERGAPAPVREPAKRRHGFGSELIEGRVPYELGGRGRVNIEAEGASCHIEFPLNDGASILETDSPRLANVFGGAIDMSGETSLSGQKILVVEDEYYLAADTARALRGAGAEVIGPCADEASAREAVAAENEHRPVTGAVLDINLREGRSFDLAREFIANETPFLFITGYDQEVIPAEFDGVTRLQKPVEFKTIVSELAAIIEGPSAIPD